MRGKGRLLPAHDLPSGITPAYAGKSTTIRAPCPHSRGSPPRMRGKVWSSKSPPFESGITPAYAGKSRVVLSAADLLEDHPRVCGEKAGRMSPIMTPLGSPPRMRGKGHTFHTDTSPARITPAYAGKRLKRSRSTVPHAAIVPLFPSVCNKPAGSDGSPAGHDAPPFLPIENAAPASPAYNLRSL